ncbi:MAG: tetratricopeptide repeat protein [Kofleriaceae bacterium]
MTTNRHRCLAPADLERLYWIAREDRPLQVRDTQLYDHVAECEQCGAAWSEIAELSELARTIEPSPTWERREEIRTTLLSKVDHERDVARPAGGWRRFWLAPLAFAAAAVALWLAWPATNPTPHSIARRANVLEHEGARSIVVAEQPNEIVRLVDGTITVSVAALGANERFRVVAGDDELSADSAAFDVTARGDHIAEVRVIHGNVRLLAAGAQKDLRAGETWRASMTAAATANSVSTVPTPVASAPVASASVASAPVAAPSPAPAPTIASTPTTRVPRKTRAPSHDEPEVAEPVIDPPIKVPEPPVASPPRARSMAQLAFDEAWVALRSDDFTKAASSFERALTTSSDAQLIEDATFWRGVALARGGEVATAVHVLSVFVQVYASSPRVGEANVMLGWMLFERGDRVEAKRRFEAGTRDPSSRVRDSATKGLAAVARR